MEKGQYSASNCFQFLSRACPVRVLCHEHAGPNGMCNCTRDGGGPFEVGNQVLVSSHRKLLWSKAMVVSVAENRNEIPAGEIERGERCVRISPGREDENVI